MFIVYKNYLSITRAARKGLLLIINIIIHFSGVYKTDLCASEEGEQQKVMTLQCAKRRVTRLFVLIFLHQPNPSPYITPIVLYRLGQIFIPFLHCTQGWV